MSRTIDKTLTFKCKYQQGDVILKGIHENRMNSTECHPGKVQAILKSDSRHGVLALGEVTGHSHKLDDLESDPNASWEMLEKGKQIFLRILEGNVAVIHEEHDTIKVPPGLYEVSIAREFDPFSESARHVAD